MLINNDPIPTDELAIETERFPEHGDFLSCVVSAGQVLDAAEIPRADWKVISGGSIALRQLANGQGNDRFSTDLDIVMTYSSPEDAYDRLLRIHGALQEVDVFSDARVIMDPRTHHGFTFTNPILEARGQGGFPLDILSIMQTSFPDSAPIPKLRGVAYDFPNDNKALFSAADVIMVDGEPVKVAHPGYVAFYKASMNRNGSTGEHGSVPKQDNKDLIRLAEMGLLGGSTRDIMAILAGHDVELLEEVEEAIRSKLGA